MNKVIAEKLDIEDRMDKMTRKQAFITVKDDLPNNSKFRFY